MLRSSLCRSSTRVLCRANGPASKARLSTVPRRPSAWSLSSSRRPLAVTAQKRFESKGAIAQEPDPNDNFLSGGAANYIDEMYMQWKHDPKSVHISWQTYFKNMESGEMPISQAFTPPPNLVPGATGGVPQLAHGLGMTLGEGSDITNHLKIQLLCRAYQARGHHKANIDPLGISPRVSATSSPRSSSSSTTSSPRRISTPNTRSAPASCLASSAKAARR